MVQKEVNLVFTSPTYGPMDWQATLAKVIWFMGQDTNASYEVIIGTDSEASLASPLRSEASDSGRTANGLVDFVSAVIVHKKGRGGIYFWARQKVKNLYSLRQRIWQEAIISLSLAQNLVNDFSALGILDNQPKLALGDLERINLEIHVDIGPNGETRQMISEIVGMIRANGFKVATKPASWGASHVADRHV